MRGLLDAALFHLLGEPVEGHLQKLLQRQLAVVTAGGVAVRLQIDMLCVKLFEQIKNPVEVYGALAHYVVLIGLCPYRPHVVVYVGGDQHVGIPFQWAFRRSVAVGVPAVETKAQCGIALEAADDKVVVVQKTSVLHRYHHAVLVGAIQHSGKIVRARLVGRRRYQLAREVNDKVFNAPFAALGARLVKLLYVFLALLLVPQPVGVRGGKMTGGNGQPYLYGVVEKIETAAVGVLELRAPPKHSFVEAGLLYLFQSRERIYLEKAAPEILSLCNFCQRHFKPVSKLVQKYAITEDLQ